MEQRVTRDAGIEVPTLSTVEEEVADERRGRRSSARGLPLPAERIKQHCGRHRDTEDHERERWK